MNARAARRAVRRLRALEAEMKRRQDLSSPLSFCPHKPHPKQAEFLALECREALYGGAAGGGKSDALLMAALQYVHVPDYAAIIFRRTFTDLALPGAIMDRAREWLSGTSARWHEASKTWHFPSGATLSFGYLENDNDRFRYQSAEFQFIGFDELTQFSARQYRYLLSRLRRLATSEVPLRARGASNPGGEGHVWVYERFVAPGCGRAFVPSKLDDNPSLDREEYRNTLAELDEVTRQQLLDGLWVQDGTGLVYRMPRLIDSLPPARDEDWTRLLSMDFGVVNECSFSILAWRKGDPTLYVEESWKKASLSPGRAADEAQRIMTDPRRPIARVIGDIGGLGKGFAQEMQERYNLPVEAAQKTNKKGYIRLFNGYVESGSIAVVRGKCEEYIAEVQSHRWKDDAHSDELKGSPNHCCDGVLYGWREAWSYLEKEAPPPPTAEERLRAEVDQMERDAEQETISRRDRQRRWVHAR